MNDLAAAYVLGVLEPEERAAFERALADSQALQREVAEYQEVCALLALEAEQDANPVNEDGWQRVQAMIAEQRDHKLAPPESRGGMKHIGWIAAAAASVAAVAFGLEVRTVEQQLADAARAADSANNALAQRNALLDDVLFAQDVQILLTSDGAVKPGVRVFWNRRDNRMVIHAFDLNPAEAGQTYQLWFIDNDGVVVPSQTFNTEDDGQGLLTVPGPGNGETLAALAVSVEPARWVTPAHDDADSRRRRRLGRNN